jgi:hypothetical protein
MAAIVNELFTLFLALLYYNIATSAVKVYSYGRDVNEIHVQVEELMEEIGQVGRELSEFEQAMKGGSLTMAMPAVNGFDERHPSVVGMGRNGEIAGELDEEGWRELLHPIAGEYALMGAVGERILGDTSVGYGAEGWTGRDC